MFTALQVEGFFVSETCRSPSNRQLHVKRPRPRGPSHSESGAYARRPHLVCRPHPQGVYWITPLKDNTDSIGGEDSWTFFWSGVS